jgi:hypothetical protein
MATFISIDVVIPEHQVVLQDQAKVLATLTDVSKYAVKGAKSVNFPTLAAREGDNIGIGDTFSPVAPNYADDSFNLSEKLGDFFPINLHQERQNQLNALEDSSRETLKAIAKQADKSMITKMVAAATAGPAPTSAILDDIVDMAKVLDDADVPQEDRYLLITNADYADLQKETKDFIRYSNDKTGVVGEVYGMKVVRSTDAALTVTIAYHKKAAAYAWQGETLFLETIVAGGSSANYELSRMFGGKATQSGAMIVKRAAA